MISTLLAELVVAIPGVHLHVGDPFWHDIQKHWVQKLPIINLEGCMWPATWCSHSRCTPSCQRHFWKLIWEPLKFYWSEVTDSLESATSAASALIEAERCFGSITLEPWMMMLCNIAHLKALKILLKWSKWQPRVWNLRGLSSYRGRARFWFNNFRTVNDDAL